MFYWKKYNIWPGVCGQVVRRRIWDVITFHVRSIYYTKLSHIFCHYELLAFRSIWIPEKNLSVDYISHSEVRSVSLVNLDLIILFLKKNITFSILKFELVLISSSLVTCMKHRKYQLPRYFINRDLGLWG